jgi:DNA-binding response OmpR family regulator
MIEIFYLKELPVVDSGPFLNQEIHLLQHVAKMITSYLNGLDLMELNVIERKKSDDYLAVFNSRQLLQRSLNNQNYGRDIFHDLMPFKVREILLIANLYDVFSIENEGRGTTSHILGGFYEFSMSDVPRITGVSTKEEALEWLQTEHFDIVVTMMGQDKNFHVDVSREIRRKFPYMPIYMLLNNSGELARFEGEENKAEDAINKVYVWNGDPKIFFAMIKNLEDRANVENDTKLGQVQVMLLVEDSPTYYSRYLPVLYSAVMEQTQLLLDKADRSSMEKALRLRARPKILHATNYEDAMDMYYKYRENLLCVISDVRFWREGLLDDKAGFRLVEQIRKQNQYLPIIMQSSDVSNKKKAEQNNAAFIHKQSKTLIQDIKDFISSYLGFGDFVFRDKNGEIIHTAATMSEFEAILKIIPDSSLLYHARWNHFSLWLIARGEIQLARIIQPYRLEDFTEPNVMRNFLLDAIARHRNEQTKGKVITFEEIGRYDIRNIASLYSGSFGGKGRGIAFINNIIYNVDLKRYIPNINISIPRTFIIGADAFEDFLNENKLMAFYGKEWNDKTLRKTFMHAKLPDALRKRIRALATIINKPLAVRSSGLFEDSLMRPFSGIFDTYLIPFNHPDLNERVKQCEDAVKMVYASVFARTARDYIRAVNYNMSDEQMAIVIQEAVGNQYENAYYPHISGVAHSYNYYPVGHCKPEDGFALLAVGLGSYVIGGERTFRFCPKYPNTEINSLDDQIRTSQNYFYAVDLQKYAVNLAEGENATLKKLNIEDAIRHGTMKHTASTYDYNNGRLIPGVEQQGITVVNFANVLKYNYIPLSKTINTLLGIFKEALGVPVEIEFAIDLNKDEDDRASFYLLQIKPLLSDFVDCEIDTTSLHRDSLLLFADKGMGNGIIEDVADLIVVNPETFDKTDTLAIAAEVEALNKQMVAENRNYVLIGPGRWGTRDRFIGIPVRWAQINNAKVIIETSLEGFPLDASYGSHFFHNITAANVGYYSVIHASSENFVNWDIIKNQEVVSKTTYCTHYRFSRPFVIKMDGKKRVGVIEMTNAH